MKIGFDGKRATQNLTGLGNYSRYIIRLLGKFYPENQYNVYALKHPAAELQLYGVDYQYPKKKVVNFYWRRHGIVKSLVKQNIDLFHGLSNEIPYGLEKSNIPSVVTIHDLIFIRYPEYYSFVDRLIYKFKFQHAASHANTIIAISQQTKQDIIQYFGVNENKIQVVYQSCDSIFQQQISQNDKDDISRKHDLPEKYILNVGTIEERKNLMLIVKALKKVDSIHLVSVGKATLYTQKVKDFITANSLTERVHFLKDVTYKELPAIYQQAEMFIYPSRFEGFGIPIVEALHSGIPVIAAKGSCLEEAGGPNSIYVDPDDDIELAKQIKFILENEEKRLEMVRYGKEYIDKFDDKKIAAQIMQLYKITLANVKR